MISSILIKVSFKDTNAHDSTLSYLQLILKFMQQLIIYLHSLDM
jgi:hypothetical protein